MGHDTATRPRGAAREARLADSTAFITAERRALQLEAIHAFGAGARMGVASISVSERLMGVVRADTTERQLRRSLYVEQILTAFDIVPFDERAGRIHAHLAFELARSGQMIGPNDLIIAATAIAHGYDVITDNMR